MTANARHADDLSPGVVGDRLVWVDGRLAFDSFRSDLEDPGENERHRESDDEQDDDEAHRPVWNFEKGKTWVAIWISNQLDDRISHRHLVTLRRFSSEKKDGLSFIAPWRQTVYRGGPVWQEPP